MTVSLTSLKEITTLAIIHQIPYCSLNGQKAMTQIMMTNVINLIWNVLC